MRLLRFLQEAATAADTAKIYNEVKSSIDPIFIEDLDNFISLNVIWPIGGSTRTNLKFKFFNGDADMIQEFLNEYKSDFPVNSVNKKDNYGASRLVLSIKINSVTFQFLASGSRGNGKIGVERNKGNAFESALLRDIEKYINDEPGIQYTEVIQKLVAAVPAGYEIVGARADGANNTSRSLSVSSSSIIATSKGSGFDLGSTVSDITLIVANASGQKKEMYLSLKYGPSVTFCNLGITKFLPADEIKNGTITNKQGLDLLKMFGIDPERFCSVFNSYSKNAKSRNDKSSVNVTSIMKSGPFENFLKSVIGYGYVLVHINGKKVHVEEISQSYLNSLKLQNAEVRYPNNGSAKIVEIWTYFPGLEIKFNFRNKQGGNYPNSLQADYKFK